MCETVCIMYMVDNNALIARSGARDRVSVVTRTSYLPSTHPTVMLHLKSITAMMDAASTATIGTVQSVLAFSGW